MRKQLRRFLSTALVGMMLTTCVPAAYADTGGSVFDPYIRSDDDEADDLASSSDAIEVTTYGELQATLASASNGTNIEILGDLSPDDGSITLNGELDAITGATLVTRVSDVKVEGNGYTISGKGYPTFDSDGGDLTVKNLTIDGAGYAAKLGGAVFVEYGGTLTMQNVTMQNCVAGSTAEYGGGGAGCLHQVVSTDGGGFIIKISNRKEEIFMSKIAVVYWSGTGNTEEMARQVAEGAKAAGAEVSTITAGEFSADVADTYDAIAFGCPSMGAEVLEEGEFQPMWDAAEPKLNGKKIALFGSYGWGDGEWMRNWEESCEKGGISLSCDYVICNDAPDDEAKEACRALGKALAWQLWPSACGSLCEV